MSLPKFPLMVVLSCLWFAAALPAQTVAASSTSDNNSKVRIVRLSEVRGDVLLDRAVGRGMGAAMANLPIVEKSRLETGQGVAEVEFEDNSSLRVGMNSIVEFPKLERTPAGATVSWVRVQQGTAYVSLLKSKAGNQFVLLFGDRELALNPGTHVRLELTAKDAEVAVLDGSVEIPGREGTIEVGKKRTVSLDLSAGEPTVAKNVKSDLLDQWDKESAGYHDRMAVMSAVSSSPYSYGVSDLAYYGSFMNTGACGTMWRPYFASAAWDPYGNGSWAWYGSGYSWVSPYPWGWMPYHYGSWSMCPGVGWGWQPGGAWNGLNNVAMMMPLRRAAGKPVGVVPPGRPPRPGDPTLVPVNLRPLVRSGLGSQESFEFRKDSAGLGVPRATLGRLDKFSHQTMTHDTARMQIYVREPNQGGMSGRAGAPNSAALGSTIHRGAAPSMGPQPSYSGRAGGSGGFPSASSSMPSTGSRGPSSAPASSGRPR